MGLIIDTVKRSNTNKNVRDHIEDKMRKITPLVLRYAPIVVLFVIGVVLARYLILAPVISYIQTRSVKVSPTPTPRTSVMVQQSYDGALAVKPIDQAKYEKIIQKAWDEALTKGSTNVVNFTNDPDLIAFQYLPLGAEEPIGLVVYRNKPVIIKTKKVIELPEGKPYRISLDRENYRLVVLFEYTSQVSELQIAETLEEAFTQVVEGKI